MQEPYQAPHRTHRQPTPPAGKNDEEMVPATTLLTVKSSPVSVDCKQYGRKIFITSADTGLASSKAMAALKSETIITTRSVQKATVPLLPLRAGFAQRAIPKPIMFLVRPTTVSCLPTRLQKSGKLYYGFNKYGQRWAAEGRRRLGTKVLCNLRRFLTRQQMAEDPKSAA